MNDIILVTYATFTGSTAEAAEFIGKVLAENGTQVEVRPVQDVTDLTPYRAVVIGSPIQSSKWLPEAMQFVQTHHAELARKPVAIFTLCMALTVKNPRSHGAVVAWLAPVRALVKPVSEVYFAGILDISRVPSFFTRLGFRISVLLGV